MSGYEEIINLPHHVSERHARMSMLDRAAQFSPFAALTGYDAAIKETARSTDSRIELDADEKEILDQKLREAAEKKQRIRITFFREDAKKSGGSYVTTEGIIKKIDLLDGTILLQSQEHILIQDMVDVVMHEGRET
jgi:hypothetical protein